MSPEPTKLKNKQQKDGERRLRAFALRFPEVRFVARDEPPLPLWIVEGYRAIAPRKLVATLELA